MAAGNLSGQSLGSFALSGGAQAILPFNTLLAGAYTGLYLQLGFSLKSTGSAFTLVVDTSGSAAAEGVDDLDLVLNTLFTNHNSYWDAGHPMFVGHNSAQLRTVLGYLNLRDLDGSFLNGTTVPSSGSAALAFIVQVPIPFNLVRLMRKSGKMWEQGSQRLYTGRYMLTVGANITNPSISLANGTATASAVTASLYARGGIGNAGLIGNTWQSERVQNQPTVPYLDNRVRLGVLDFNPAATNAVTSYQTGNEQLVSPSQKQAFYQTDRLYAGGFDITGRCTPVITAPEEIDPLELGAVIGRPNYIQLVSGASNFSYYDVTTETPNANQAAAVAQSIGGGGTTTTSRPSPLPPGTNVPNGVNAMLPISVGLPVPGAPSSPGQATAKTPNAIQNQLTAGGSMLSRLQSRIQKSG